MGDLIEKLKALVRSEPPKISEMVDLEAVRKAFEPIMPDNVVDMPVGENIDPVQALAEALKDVDDLEHILVIGQVKGGGFYCVHSKMTRAEGLYLCEVEKIRIMAPVATDEMNEWLGSEG